MWQAQPKGHNLHFNAYNVQLLLALCGGKPIEGSGDGEDEKIDGALSGRKNAKQIQQGMVSAVMHFLANGLGSNAWTWVLKLVQCPLEICKAYGKENGPLAWGMSGK